MDASDLVAIGALLVASLSLWVSWGREKRDKWRFAREELDAQRSGARLSVEYVTTKTEPGRDTYILAVTNSGDRAAHHVVLRVEDTWGQVVARSGIGLTLLRDERREFSARRRVVAWSPPLTPIVEWRTEADEPRSKRSRLLFDVPTDDVSE